MSVDKINSINKTKKEVSNMSIEVREEKKDEKKTEEKSKRVEQILAILERIYLEQKEIKEKIENIEKKLNEGLYYTTKNSKTITLPSFTRMLVNDIFNKLLNEINEIKNKTNTKTYYNSNSNGNYKAEQKQINKPNSNTNKPNSNTTNTINSNKPFDEELIENIDDLLD
jgi:hypothetical protein